jgi:epoxyqueuosine reductase
MATSTSEAAQARDLVRARACALGFDAVGFAAPEAVAEAGNRLADFVAAGLHGDMGWLADTLTRRRSPRALMPDARAVVMVGLNYAPHRDPLADLNKRDRGTVSVYARNRDYHDVVKGRLKELAGWMHATLGGAVKLFVDTAPVLEKPLAEAAGLGWQGKHTNLVSRRHGSWLFLGSVFTTLELAADAAEGDRCGRCRRCLDVCPTDAFPAPYRLDARRCISYLTIEHKGHIPRALRPLMGNRVYGCDDCLAVCPWNKFARPATEPGLIARDELAAPRLADLAALDDASFRKLFAGSPVKRTGRDRFVRNVLIAIGNGTDGRLVPAAQRLLDDPSPLVRAAAVWALSRLLPARRFAALRAEHGPREADAAVREEWEAGYPVSSSLSQ